MLLDNFADYPCFCKMLEFLLFIVLSGFTILNYLTKQVFKFDLLIYIEKSWHFFTDLFSSSHCFHKDFSTKLMEIGWVILKKVLLSVFIKWIEYFGVMEHF